MEVFAEDDQQKNTEDSPSKPQLDSLARTLFNQMACIAIKHQCVCRLLRGRADLTLVT